MKLQSLASVLGRTGQQGYFAATSSFFDAVAQDPILSRTIMVAEPWDIGTYQLGRGFPGLIWLQWNGLFRDDMRAFVKGDGKQSVMQLIKSHGATINGFTLYVVGEGIERKKDDFAAEVAAMARN
jgi:glycogen operon protein